MIKVWASVDHSDCKPWLYVMLISSICLIRHSCWNWNPFFSWTWWIKNLILWSNMYIWELLKFTKRELKWKKRLREMRRKQQNCQSECFSFLDAQPMTWLQPLLDHVIRNQCWATTFFGLELKSTVAEITDWDQSCHYKNWLERETLSQLFEILPVNNLPLGSTNKVIPTDLWNQLMVAH